MFEQSRYGPTKSLSAAPLAMLVLTAAIIAVAMTRMLAAAEPPTGLVIAGGVGSLALLLLALLQVDVAVLLAFVLLAIVFVEPAPSDIVFVVVIAVAAATGRLRFDQFPFVVGASLAVFLALNLVSFVDVIDLGRASRFFAITAYLILLAVWLTGYVRSRERARIVAGGYVVAAVTMGAAASLALFVPLPWKRVSDIRRKGTGLVQRPERLRTVSRSRVAHSHRGSPVASAIPAWSVHQAGRDLRTSCGTALVLFTRCVARMSASRLR